MFQTEPIKFLQSLSTEWSTEFFWFVSQLGYAEFYVPVLLLLTFGVSLRRGFLLIQTMLWVALVTDLLKHLFGLPRPVHVDSAVRMIAEGVPNATPFTGMGGRGFWDLPDAQAIAAVRATPGISYGLPSGHVSGTVTFWGGLSLLFRHRAIRAAAVTMIALMPVSRMVLGRHFVADVLGGLALGGAFVAAAYALFIRAGARPRLLGLVRLSRRLGWKPVAAAVALLGAPLVLPLLSTAVGPDDAGRLLGLNIAFLALAWTGLPDDRGAWPRRAGRVAVAATLYAATAWLVGLAADAAMLAAIPAFVALWGGVRLGLKLGLYSPCPTGSARPPLRP